MAVVNPLTQEGFCVWPDYIRMVGAFLTTFTFLIIIKTEVELRKVVQAQCWINKKCATKNGRHAFYHHSLYCDRYSCAPLFTISTMFYYNFTLRIKLDSIVSTFFNFSVFFLLYFVRCAISVPPRQFQCFVVMCVFVLSVTSQRIGIRYSYNGARMCNLPSYGKCWFTFLFLLFFL